MRAWAGECAKQAQATGLLEEVACMTPCVPACAQPMIFFMADLALSYGPMAMPSLYPRLRNLPPTTMNMMLDVGSRPPSLCVAARATRPREHVSQAAFCDPPVLRPQLAGAAPLPAFGVALNQLPIRFDSSTLFLCSP